VSHHIVDIILGLKDQSLINGKKFANVEYVSICDNKEVNVYNGRIFKIVVSEVTVLKGWQCPRTRIQRTLLPYTLHNKRTNTLILDSPSGLESLNSMYSLPSSKHTKAHIMACYNKRPPPAEATNNVYKFLSIKSFIWYLHGVKGFPRKATWLKAICKGATFPRPL
jgi:hypothetical protein